MNEKFTLFLFKLLVHWVLCQMLSAIVVCSSGGIFNDLSKGIFPCCSKDISGSCKDTCENLSLVQLTSSSIKEARIQNLRKFCPDIQTDFWTCMNHTLDSIERGSSWIGRSCCTKALVPVCQQGCALSASTKDLKSFCRESDEYTLFTCIDQLERNMECCSNAKTHDCLQICQQMLFEKNGTINKLQTKLHKNCKDINYDVIDCVNENIDTKSISNPDDLMHCCRYGSTKQCKDECRSQIVNQELSEGEIIDLLIPFCGVVNLSSEFWMCFLNNENHVKNDENIDEVSRIKQIGIDSAKLHCCERAQSTQCRRLCYDTFYGNIILSERFELECLQNSHEMVLKRCIEEVDYPVEVGCDGLSFCSNFNNRPTELFRSCNAVSDQAAMSDLKMWEEQNILKLPGLDLPIMNISYCLPEKWKAIACTLQLKPCTKSQHFGQICWEDCLDVLSKCIDWTRLESGHSAASLCSKLSPDTPDARRLPCISIRPYLEPSDEPYTGNDLKTISPCRGQQCNSSSEVCLVNRKINKPSCIKGCPLGEGSNYLVTIGQYVRLPASINKGCYKICKCMESGMIEKCQPVPCVPPKSCQIGNKTIEHGTSIQIECNTCTCFAEEITCTKKQCRMSGVSERAFTTLPCNCPFHFIPVCGKNGRTYPSGCLAKCVGLHDAEFEFGSCEMRNPCDQNVCPTGTICFPSRNVCLSNMHKPCPQHRCVSESGEDCPLETVTDTNMEVHPSLCSLVRTERKLSYFGDLSEPICRSAGIVCGINGVTYNSECEAMSDYSMVDYFGPCKAVGLIGSDFSCSSVKCPRRIPENCKIVIPTGSCCPICGAAIKIIYSRKQIDRGIYALKNANTEALTLNTILKTLQQLVKVSSCYLSGFLTFETDIMVVVYSIHKNPTEVQVEICRQEALKIVNLITTKSPHFTSDLGLSALLVATNIEPIESSSNIIYLKLPWSLLILIIVLNFKLIF